MKKNSEDLHDSSHKVKCNKDSLKFEHNCFTKISNKPYFLYCKADVIGYQIL